ncbi:MAG: hypothetical protein GFH27_549445n3 [Chloroflexi bacterium AL-W]|nr:hypothetical protein [Chloroflexi bacterium AL-N1]NOK71659.1 hypothetical protein [Chloroflexi bacterium AL-N10]NOK79000.1 hypothetical protein [Chloroflexi bacterium AL-N5]NOK86434.1 hypothetical protein [Chloroflexi bacterium AL-W]NOK93400.1 hypothetical protein [Chloroflexi bacterium AL-N15]
MSQTNISSPPTSKRNITPIVGLAWHKLGAIAYVLWGLWHIPVVIRLWTQGTRLVEPAGVGLRLQQGAFHILFFVLCAIIIGMWLNWRNSRLGYWLSLFTISWTELGLFILFMIPGLFPWLPTVWIGPTLWLLAVVCTTLGQRYQPVTP